MHFCLWRCISPSVVHFYFPIGNPPQPPKKPENVSEHTDAQAAHPYSLRMGFR